MRVCVWWGREGFRDRVCVLMSDIMTIEKEEEKKTRFNVHVFVETVKRSPVC